MRRFRYVTDPVCVAACVAYVINRWLLPHTLKGPFLRDHFDDTLLIPAALPFVLWLQARLRLRPAAAWPTWPEIILHLAVWSIAAEVLAPRMYHHAVADISDVVAYAAGAVVADLIWQRRR